jgi:hypothetical protein
MSIAGHEQRQPHITRNVCRVKISLREKNSDGNVAQHKRINFGRNGRRGPGRRDLANFSAIILDRKLPNATADEMLPAIGFAAPGASVVIVTGYSDSTFSPMAVAEIRA